MNSVKDFRGKIEPPVEKGVLKIERYAQRLTQGYSAYGGSYLWAPGAHRVFHTVLAVPRWHKIKVIYACAFSEGKNRQVSHAVLLDSFHHK